MKKKICEFKGWDSSKFTIWNFDFYKTDKLDPNKTIGEAEMIDGHKIYLDDGTNPRASQINRYKE